MGFSILKTVTEKALGNVCNYSVPFLFVGSSLNCKAIHSGCKLASENSDKVI